MKTMKIAALTIVTALSLSACGGGGGGGDSSTPSGNNNSGGTPAQPNQDKSTIVTQVAASTYAASSEQATAYSILNSERQQCGFGLLAQNSNLDTAAAAHSLYLSTNSSEMGHYEVSGHTNYYASAPADRATKAGYSYSSLGEGVVQAQGAAIGMRWLLSAPYHLLGAMGSYKDVGVGYSIYSGFTVGALTVDYGSVGNGQTVDSKTVLTYPCNGSTQVATGYTNEDISYTGSGSGSSGQPVLIQVNPANTLKITSYAIYDGVGNQINTILLTTDNDPQHMVGKHQALIIPPAYLQHNANYTVNVSGTNNGVAFTNVSFQFKTGNVGP
ncbi:CAP domain-containing protein [Chromobacterium vaccinii]|uniref:CAP domain-containing protein n=1 Tax=Chromobacterium vaccinii TaxID=1108595 RepID=UPI00345929E5